MSELVYSGTGVIVDVRKQVIPKMYVATFTDKENNVTIEFDVHEDLVIYKQGQKVSIAISKTLPEYRDGVDYVARAVVASIKREEETFKYLLSAGGLLFMVTSPRELPLAPMERVYVRVSVI